MAHYAFLDENNVVTEVIVGIDETELIEGLSPEQWYANFKGQTCVRASYNAKICYNYAGIGYTYDPIADAFVAPKFCEHDEAVFNDDVKRWQCSNAFHAVNVHES